MVDTLNLDQRQIRILCLHPSTSPSADILCSLSVASLIDNPRYDALSYAWGSSKDPRVVFVNRTPIQVTPNLECALRHLRQPTANRYLWVDAVCIDQKNVIERNAQVSMMGDIYRSAERVCVWLGPADELSDFAFDRIPSVDAAFLTHPDASRVWSFYVNCVQRPYVSRVWTIQEFVLATNDPVVCCGHKQAPWTSFMSAYKTLALDFFTQLDMVGDTAEGSMPQVLAKLKYDLFDELRETVRVDGGADLRQLLIMSRTSQSSEPRDRIYGLIQMLNTEDRGHFVIDYGKPVAQVYAEAISLIFEQGDGPRFLAGMWCPSARNPLVPGLPSWTPDFSRQTAERAGAVPSSNNFHPPFPRSASGSGADADNGTVLEDLRTLRVEALPVDEIAQVVHFGDTLAACLTQLVEVEALAANARSIFVADGKLRPLVERFRASEPLWRLLVSDKSFGSGYRVAPEAYEDTYCQLRASPIPTRASDASAIPEYERALAQHLPRCTFFTTTMGLIGIGMPSIRAGDRVTIWFGANVPFVVRPLQQDTQECLLVGAAYVGGIMEGQMVDEMYCEDLLDSAPLFVI